MNTNEEVSICFKLILGEFCILVRINYILMEFIVKFEYC